MTSLTFGTALREEHTVLAEQFAYELVYFLLLATRVWDRFSVDALLRARVATEAPARVTKERGG